MLCLMGVPGRMTVAPGAAGGNAMEFHDITRSSPGLPATLIARRARASVLQPGDPAIELLTDFTKERPVTVSPDRQIDLALGDMIRGGVRALLVLRRQSVIGLITSFDIQGGRPALIVHEGMKRRQDVTVEDIMTPWGDLHTIWYHALATTCAGDLEASFHDRDVSHLLVIEMTGDRASAVVRGLVSRSDVVRALGAADESLGSRAATG
jgi:CBS domain-containing protein